VPFSRLSLTLVPAAALTSCTLLVPLDQLQTDGSAESGAGPGGAGGSGGGGGSANQSSAASGGLNGGGAGGEMATGYASLVLEDEPVAYWRLGERSGTTARDEMGSYDGQYAGRVELGVEGALERDADTAVRFAGVDGSVDIGDVLDFEASTFSIELWLVPEDFVFKNYEERYLVSKLEPGFGGYHSYVFQRPAEQGVGFDVCDASETCDSASVTLPLLDEYMHVVFVHDGDYLRIYVDGQLRALEPATLTADASATPLRLGAGYYFFGGYLPGSLDEVAIYDHELSGERVLVHFLGR
jgi:hypothetical protein